MFKIIVKTLQGKILTYSVKEYKVINGYVTFKDRVTSKIKRFHSANTEIEEYKEVEDDEKQFS